MVMRAETGEWPDGRGLADQIQRITWGFPGIVTDSNAGCCYRN